MRVQDERVLSHLQGWLAGPSQACRLLSPLASLLATSGLVATWKTIGQLVRWTLEIIKGTTPLGLWALFGLGGEAGWEALSGERARPAPSSALGPARPPERAKPTVASRMMGERPAWGLARGLELKMAIWSQAAPVLANFGASFGQAPQGREALAFGAPPLAILSPLAPTEAERDVAGEASAGLPSSTLTTALTAPLPIPFTPLLTLEERRKRGAFGLAADLGLKEAIRAQAAQVWRSIEIPLGLKPRKKEVLPIGAELVGPPPPPFLPLPPERLAAATTRPPLAPPVTRGVAFGLARDLGLRESIRARAVPTLESIRVFPGFKSGGREALAVKGLPAPSPIDVFLSLWPAGERAAEVSSSLLAGQVIAEPEGGLTWVRPAEMVGADLRPPRGREHLQKVSLGTVRAAGEINRQLGTVLAHVGVGLQPLKPGRQPEKPPSEAVQAGKVAQEIMVPSAQTGMTAGEIERRLTTVLGLVQPTAGHRLGPEMPPLPSLGQEGMAAEQLRIPLLSEERLSQVLIQLVELVRQLQQQAQQPAEPASQSTFNVTLQAGDLEGERDLRPLGQELAKLLADEARRYGIEV